MIKWAAPQYLYLFFLAPVFIIGFLWHMARRSRRLRKFVDPAIVPRITDSVSVRLQAAQHVLLVAGFVFLIIALARPKWGERLQVYKGAGIDVVIALDASKSMLAQDLKPDRLRRAKTEISLLLESLRGNRVGITAFAGECYVMCPLTTDIDAAKLFLDIISPDVVPRPGTDLERAITVSNSLFDPGEDTHKALVLFTDGDNLSGDPVAVVNKIRDQGTKLFAVGVATVEGSPVPEFDPHGNFVSYKKDRDDKIVMSRLSERLLIVLAKAADGRYFRSEGAYVDRLVAELDRIKRKEIGAGEYVEYEERYQYFLLPAFALVLLGALLNDRKGWWYDL
ncbi:VWA domain-containing protein [candidate division WOR-3 bacterium]|nr:VWA domain-containing protein [candidate division WOR-3 bacterium]